jgi:hypothetical protein
MFTGAPGVIEVHLQSTGGAPCEWAWQVRPVQISGCQVHLMRTLLVKARLSGRAADIEPLVSKEAHRARFFWIGLLSPSDSQVQRKSSSSLDSGSGVQSKSVSPLLVLGLWSPQSKSDSPLDPGARVQSKSDSPLDSGSGVRARIGVWFGPGLLVCSGLGLGGRAVSATNHSAGIGLGKQGTRKRRPVPRFSFLKRCFLLRPVFCGKTACFSMGVLAGAPRREKKSQEKVHACPCRAASAPSLGHCPHCPSPPPPQPQPNTTRPHYCKKKSHARCYKPPAAVALPARGGCKHFGQNGTMDGAVSKPATWCG